LLPKEYIAVKQSARCSVAVKVFLALYTGYLSHSFSLSFDGSVVTEYDEPFLGQGYGYVEKANEGAIGESGKVV
jgi:hypothetical protein